MTQRAVIILPTLARGGMERDAVRMVRGFRRHGWDVTVVSLKEPHTLEAEFREAGAEMYFCRQRRGLEIGPVLRLAREKRLRGVDILVGYGFHATVVAPLLGAWWRAGCVYAGYGGAPERPFQTWLLTWLLRPLTHYWLVNSENLAERVIELGARRADVHVLANELDPPDPDEPALERDPLLLGIAARLEPIKRHDVLLRALARARQESGLDIRLRIVGDGTRAAALRELVSELDLSDAVEFTGEHPRAWRYLGDIGLACLSSESESTPNFLLEAMKRGVPVIATAVGGVPEFVVPGETGTLVQANDVESYAREILRVVADRDDALRMADNALQMVDHRFGASRADTLISISKGGA